MPVHARIICIGGNVLAAGLFLLGALGAVTQGAPLLLLVMLTLAGVAGYSAWVVEKFRRHLAQGDSVRQELEIERTREEIERLRASRPDLPPS